MFFFTLIKEDLDLHRYKSNADQKAKIIELVLPIDPLMAEDLHVLIDQVIVFLQELKIHYHNIQHTLEVTLGTTQAVVQYFKEGSVKDVRLIILPIVAALFHDIGYSNREEIISFMQKLSLDEIVPLFSSAKDPSFLEDFKSRLEGILETNSLTGAEFHLHHVYLSQIFLPRILKGLPDTFIHKEYLLSKDSLEKINAIISLTDIKADPKRYRENRRQYLLEQDCLFLGESVATSDLLTQLATSDRLSKGPALYHEFFFGHDDKYWQSGLALMATTTIFYESFAKKLIHVEVLSVLDKYFSSINFSNPYRTNLKLIFFLHKLFEPLYQKLLSSEPITDQDMSILEGLEKNGLQKEIVDLFLATRTIRKGISLSNSLEKALYDLLKEKDSFLGVVLGDEVRITLMCGAALSQNSEKMIELLVLRKPELLVERSLDLLKALQMIDSCDREKLLQGALQVLESIPKDAPKLVTLKEALLRMQSGA